MSDTLPLPPGHPRRGTPPDATRPSGPTRRQVLTMLGLGGAAAGGYGTLRTLGDGGSRVPTGTGGDRGTDPGTAVASGEPMVAGGIDGRLLVIVELSGGNDGLATVVPDDGRLRDMRPGLMPAESGYAAFAPGTQVHAGLAPLVDRGLAVFEGIGTTDPDGSHFEMERRWWAGDGTGDARLHTGFLGRLCDALAADAIVGGVSLGGGAAPALRGDTATTIGLPDPWAAWFLTERDDPWFESLRAGLSGLGATRVDDPARVAAARRGLDDALAFANVLSSIDDDDRGFPETDLGWQLRLAGGLLDSDVGLRVVHVPFGGFDTHDNQRYEHDALMSELGPAIAALQDDLAARGIADRTLIATTSEFGRRPLQNGGGTDHGTAGPALLCGPVVPGLHGEPPRLDRLDDDGNLVATAMIEDYYATLAESWFGIPADDVLPRRATPAPEILAT